MVTNTASVLPAQIAHLKALNRRCDRTVEVEPTQRGYQVSITATRADRTRELRVHLVRRKHRWVADGDPVVRENGTEVDVFGSLPELLRKLSQSGDLVGAPKADTRMPGANPTLRTRRHTVIRT